MNSIKKAKWFAYAGFALAIIAVILNFMGIINGSILSFLLPIFGFAGIEALRAHMDSKGWKTYIFAGLGLVVAILSAAHVIDSAMANNLIAAIVMVTGVTLTQGVTKANG